MLLSVRPAAAATAEGSQALSQRLMEKYGRTVSFGIGVHILLSHLHMDHIMGLFNFSLLHDPAAEICLYGDTGLRSRLDAVLGPPYWPLGLEDFHARVEVRELTAGARLSLGEGVELSTLRGNHPGGSLLYRLEAEGKTLVYALDCEMEEGVRGALVPFAENADLLVWDATFAPGELKKGWGHSTWRGGKLDPELPRIFCQSKCWEGVTPA